MTAPALLEGAWTDPVTGCRGCTLFEVRGLARGMTLKEGLNYDPNGRYVPLGGAKGGIDRVTDPAKAGRAHSST